MDIKAHPPSLESLYREAVSTAAAAKAQYLALLKEGATPSAVIQRARQYWIQWDERTRALGARMSESDRPARCVGRRANAPPGSLERCP